MEARANSGVIEIAPLDTVERACRAIAGGPEPEGYEDRREVLEGLRDLQVRVEAEEVTITGKIPVPTCAPQKNCKDRVGAIGRELGLSHF